MLALAVLVLGLPRALLMRRRERAEPRAAADGLASAFSAGAVPLPVRYGLAEADTAGAGEAGPRGWDAGPSRAGALAVGRETLRLRGADGAALDLPLDDVAGVALVPSGVAWVANTVDVLLNSGAGIECRSPEAVAIMDAFGRAGVHVLES
ncbi:hypothetical protein OIE75_21790 [Streptomyces sp. NBC_01723]|uniref:hypothetical protein n=1 Tax=Streptomyces sp. NBC_01723 TaxID=2975921 RepID=UPI002E2FC1A2|nr:hypothetical protein [Streptomyces sp. NBC_01723]